jgi:hypothetical protein
MMTIDKTKPIWRVRGRLKAPDSRRCTAFVNAEAEEAAILAANAEFNGALDPGYMEAMRIPPETIARWEKMLLQTKPSSDEPPMNPNPPVNILSKSTIQQIESGTRKVQPLYRDKLAERLGITPKERLTLTLMEPTGEPIDGKVLLISALLDGGDLTTDQERIFRDFLEEVGGMDVLASLPEKPVTS